jgi:cytochrome c556
MNKTLISAALAVAVTATAAWAATPAENVAARQNNFKQIGHAQKAISDELKKPSPDVAVLRSSTQVLAGLAPNVHRWFPRGTGVESGAKTGALPIIWQQNAQFNGRANQLVNATRGLQRAAASGNVDQIKAAFPAVGGACKGCHDTFKGPK